MTGVSQERIQRAKEDGRFILTSRLFMIPLEVSDAPEAFKWCGDSDVTEFMMYSVYDNADGVAKWIAESGHDCFGIFLRANGRLIGSGAVNRNSRGMYALGYNLAKAYWGKGYCTEASKSMLAHRVAQGITDFVCEHAVDNVRSGRVIQKCGFVFTEKGSYTSFDGTRTFDSLKYSMSVCRHEMDVDGKWFYKIADGSKTTELRLFDEKRRKINVGDYVILRNLAENADYTKCVVKVTALHRFGDFASLYQNLDMTKCGYGANESASPDDMFAYYSLERQKQYGVVGIEFELLAVL